MNRKLLLIGNGKHAAVVYEAAMMHGHKVVGVISQDKDTRLPVPIVGSDSQLKNFSDHEFVVAIGDNARREKVYRVALSAGLVPAEPIIHPHAFVSPSARIGAGTVVMAGAIVQPHAKIGDNCIINTGATVDHDCVVNNHAHVCPGVNLAGTVNVGEGALVGTGTAVMPEMTIGDWAKVGAGSVIHKNVKANLTIIKTRHPGVKVLVFAPVVGRGGVHRMVERLLPALIKQADQNWHFHVLSQKNDEMGQPINWDGATFQQVGLEPAPKHPHLFQYLVKHQQMFQIQAARIEADVIWMPQPWWTLRTPEIAFRTPFVPTIPDFAFDYLDVAAPLAQGFREETHQYRRFAAMTCFPSDYQRRWAEDKYGFVHTSTIHYAEFLPLAFNPTEDEAKRVRAKYNLPEQYTLAFHCANHKDPGTILNGQIIARKQAKVGPLVMAGLETEWYKGPTAINSHALAVQQIIKRHGYKHGQDLFILGTIPDADIAGLYKGATCAVTASRSEGGLSATIYEAFAASTPVVFSDLEVFTERLGTEGAYGYCFRRGDAPGLAGAIMAVYADPEAAQKRSQKALEFVQKRTWGDVAQDYLEVFENAKWGA